MANPLPVQIGHFPVKEPRIELTVPYVHGLGSKQAENAINGTIQKATQDLIRRNGYYENPQVQITGTFELKTNERNVLSLTLEQFSYSGGAHGMTFLTGLTFDVETGQPYSLTSLFKPGSDYVSELSKDVARQIKERDIFTFEPFGKISPRQDFYIADKSLVLIYQLYELTAYAYGFPFFPISVYSFQDIISEKGPLSKMLG